MNTKPTPSDIEALVSQFARGRCFNSETEARALRDALSVGQPAFRSSEDVLEDLDRLVPIYRASQLSPTVPQNSTAAPILAASSSAPAAPVPGPQGNAVVSASGSPKPSGILAQYEAVRHDPIALAEFLTENEEAVRREIQRMGRDTQEAGRRPAGNVPSGASASAALLKEYAAAKDDPDALADLFADPEKGSALREIAIHGEEAVTAASSVGESPESLLACYQAVRNSPLQLALFLTKNRAAVMKLLRRGAAA